MPLNQTILNELKSALEKERDELISELKSIAIKNPRAAEDWIAQFPKFEPEENASSSALEEEAEEIEEYEERLETEHSNESRLLEIAHALERIERGTYGKCKKCGADIPLERLRANPVAEYDIEHEPQ